MWPRVARVPRPSRSQLASSVLALLLLCPAAGSLQSTGWNLHSWRRLRDAHRESPQTATDRYYRALVPYVPASGSLCLLRADTPTASDPLPTQLQYALAPRQIVSALDCDFVIAVGSEKAIGSNDFASSLQLVKTIDDDLRLFRRRPQ